jgi:hypothetical protein
MRLSSPKWHLETLGFEHLRWRRTCFIDFKLCGPMAVILAQGCRHLALQQVGSYRAYTGRAADAFGTSALDPSETSAHGGGCINLMLWQDRHPLMVG